MIFKVIKAQCASKIENKNTRSENMPREYTQIEFENKYLICSKYKHTHTHTPKKKDFPMSPKLTQHLHPHSFQNSTAVSRFYCQMNKLTNVSNGK